MSEKVVVWREFEGWDWGWDSHTLLHLLHFTYITLRSLLTLMRPLFFFLLYMIIQYLCNFLSPFCFFLFLFSLPF